MYGQITMDCVYTLGGDIESNPRPGPRKGRGSIARIVNNECKKPNGSTGTRSRQRTLSSFSQSQPTVDRRNSMGNTTNTGSMATESGHITRSPQRALPSFA